MNQFIFDSYEFSTGDSTARFRYRFDDGRKFEEKIRFITNDSFDEVILDRALFLAFMVIGTSYYKTFPTQEVVFEKYLIDGWQADFLNEVYQEGLSQFAFENDLHRQDLAHFTPNTDHVSEAVSYIGEGRLVLQSGGKDSLLVASLLSENNQEYTPLYITNSDHYPHVLDSLGQPIVIAKRELDLTALKAAAADGAKNGHVPVTYIIESLALVQAILSGKNEVLVSIAHEGEEPHAFIDDLAVTHQWSKTWQAEQLISEYVERYISPDIKIGSPLRRYSELRVAELFVKHAWEKYGHSFSSCNRANYKQGENNSELQWCGECPKCANSYLLFAPFVEAEELKSLFGGQDLFEKPMLQEIFKGLLNVDGVMKPFECVGETDELRYAYSLAQAKSGYGQVSFEVPASSYDYMAEYPAQPFASI